MERDSDPNPQPAQPTRDEPDVPAEARVINTHGGDYAEGSIDKRQGTFVQGEHVTVVAEEIAYNVAGLPNPYLGLRAFTYADRASFAGRDTLVSATVERITALGNQHTLVFVTGASGSGKSSFVQAGLVPALEIFYTRRNLAVQHATIRPGARPMAALADGLLQLHLPADASFAAAKPFMIGVPSSTPSHNTVGVLVLDQLEEVFSPQCDSSQRDTLFAILVGLPPFELLRMHIIATVRADFLPDLFGYPQLYDIAKQGIDLRAMRIEELHEAIQRPLQHSYPDKRFEPALLHQLAADAAEDAAYLPLLQVSLEDLFRRGRLTRDQYDSLAHSLGARADAVQDYVDHDGQRVQPRPDEERAEIIQVFLDLVRVSLDDDPRRDVRRRQPLSSLLRGDPLAQQRRLRLIRELATARLLSTGAAMLESGSPASKDVEVDIIHESLIMRWERLQAAIAAQRTMLERRERFGQALAEWKEHAHDRNAGEYLLAGVRLAEAEALKAGDDVIFREQDAERFYAQSVQKRDEARKRQLRRARQIAAVLGVLVLLTLAAASLAVQGQGIANSERATAVAASQRADNQAATAVAESQRADSQAATAVAESQRADSQAATAVAATDLAQQRERIARVRELAAQARAVAEEYPQRGVLLAVEAVQLMRSYATDVPEARDTLVAGVTAISGTALVAGDGAVLAHAISQDSHWAALAKANGDIILLDLTAPDPLAQLRVLRSDLQTTGELYFAHNGAVLVAAYRNLDTADASDRAVRWWNLQDPAATALAPAQSQAGALANYAVSPDRSRLAGLTSDGQLMLWSLDNPGQGPAILRGQPATLAQLGLYYVPGSNQETRIVLRFSPNSRWLVAIGEDDRQARVWDVTRPEAADAQVLDGADAHVVANEIIDYYASGRPSDPAHLYIVTAAEADALVWDFDQAGPALAAERVAGMPSDPRIMLWSPDRRWLAAGATYGLALWDLAAPGSAPQTILSEGSGASYLGITSDQRWLYAAHGGQLAGGNLTKWDLQAPQPWLARAESGKRFKSTIEVSRKGDILAGNEPATPLYDVWLVNTHQEVQTVSSPADSSRTSDSTPVQIWFVDDDAALVTVRGLVVTLWDVVRDFAGSRLAARTTLRGHEQEIADSFVSPDSRWLVTIDAGTNVRVWNLAAYPAPAPQADRPEQATDVPATATPVPPLDDLLELACRRANRNLTLDEWRQAMGAEPYRRTCPALPDGAASSATTP